MLSGVPGPSGSQSLFWPRASPSPRRGKEAGMPAPAGPFAPKERKNQLLELLPNGEHERLMASMDRIAIEPHDVFQRPGEDLRNVYFPLWGVVSLITPLQDGTAIETATVGNEGMVGVHAMLGGGAIGNAQAIG